MMPPNGERDGDRQQPVLEEVAQNEKKATDRSEDDAEEDAQHRDLPDAKVEERVAHRWVRFDAKHHEQAKECSEQCAPQREPHARPAGEKTEDDGPRMAVETAS
jgi:hypothetical protein